MRESTLTFTRQEEGSITTIGLISINHQDNIDRNELLSRLRSGLTEWVAKSEEGADAWSQSCQSFNAGDFSLYYENESLRSILSLKGVYISEVITIDEGSGFDYDMILPFENSLQ